MNRLSRLHLTRRATAIILALLIALMAIAIAVNSPMPTIDEQFGDTSLHFAADRAWSLFPGDCVKISWHTEGIESLHIDGRGEIGWGERAFCPQVNHTAARFAVRTPDELQREFQMRILFLPDQLLYLAGFVGVLGSLGLAIYFLWTNRLDRALNPRWVGVALVSLIALGIVLRLSSPSPPRLFADDGKVAVSMWADKASLAFPHECVKIHVSTTGARSVLFNGEEIGLADNLSLVRHCDREGSTARLEVVGTDGVARQYQLAFFVPWQLFAQAARAPYVSLSQFCWLLLATLCAPFAIETMRARDRSNWIPLLVFAWLALMLYLPFGFDSPPQRERWELAYYADSGVTAFSAEYRIRPLIRLPSALALAIDSESFVGFNLVQCGLYMLSMSLLYGIIRKLGARPLYAFLIAALFFVYPVNDALTSLRNLTPATGAMLLLLASWFALDYLEQPRRLTLAGMLLALLLNVESYEAGLALIVALPCFLWLWRGEIIWRRFNLMLAFCSASVLKVGHTILNYTTGRSFYQDDFLDPTTDYGALLAGQNPLQTFGKVMSELYADTFAGGWLEALQSIGANQWMLPTILALLGVGAAAYSLSRVGGQPLSNRGLLLALLGGLLWIVPAASVLVWVPAYNLDIGRRLAYYSPSGAAVATFCLLMLLTAKLKRQRARDYALIALCLLLMLPALSRLFVQHDHFTRSSRQKAAILYQILEIAPRPKPGTHLVLMTDMDTSELRDAQIRELDNGTVFKSALRILYQEHAPASIYFCLRDDDCGLSHGDAIRFDPEEPGEHLRDTLVLELRRDLIVELVEDPFTRYGWNIDIDYDPNHLYDSDAPIPARAQSMLGRAIRRGAD